MKLVSQTMQPHARRYVIESDDCVGFYLYVFEGDRCVRDYLQDTLEIAIQQAFDDFHVPKNSWKRIDGP